MSDDSSSDDGCNNGGLASVNNNNSGLVSGECIDEMELDGMQKAMLTCCVKTELFEKGHPIINKDTHLHSPDILVGVAKHLSILMDRFLNFKTCMKKRQMRS